MHANRAGRKVNPPSYTEKDGAVETTTALSGIPSSITQNPSEKLKQLEKLPEHKQEEKSPELESEGKPTKTSSVDKDLK